MYEVAETEPACIFEISFQYTTRGGKENIQKYLWKKIIFFFFFFFFFCYKKNPFQKIYFMQWIYSV